MSEKVELLKTFGFSEDLLKYFQGCSEEQAEVKIPNFESEIVESLDTVDCDISNINQVEIVATTLTLNSQAE